MDLPLNPPLRAWPSSHGLLVTGHFTGSAAGLREARFLGARVFVALGQGVWRELPPSQASGPVEEWHAGQLEEDETEEEATPGRTILVATRGRAWSLPDPGVWPALETILDWGSDLDWGSEANEPQPAATDHMEPRFEFLRLTRSSPGKAWDGVLFQSRAASRGRPAVATYLHRCSAAELRDFRLGEAEGCWWLFAPRGLPTEFPRAGRSLQNLGSAVEPVLVPLDRAPLPRLSAFQIRAAFEAEEGEGLLWWDRRAGEEYVLFPRSALRLLTPDLVLERKW